MSDTSILDTLKKMLSIESTETAFDTDLIIHINSALMVLNQNGIGPETGFFITGSSETWSNFLGTDTLYEGVKTYIYLNVKLLFDPPPTSFVITAYENLAKEYLWRLRLQAEPPLVEENL